MPQGGGNAAPQKRSAEEVKTEIFNLREEIGENIGKTVHGPTDSDPVAHAEKYFEWLKPSILKLHVLMREIAEDPSQVTPIAVAMSVNHAITVATPLSGMDTKEGKQKVAWGKDFSRTLQEKINQWSESSIAVE